MLGHSFECCKITVDISRRIGVTKDEKEKEKEKEIITIGILTMTAMSLQGQSNQLPFIQKQCQGGHYVQSWPSRVGLEMKMVQTSTTCSSIP